MTEADQIRTPEYDVAICGGGLAGLALARQLKLRMPDLKVALIEKVPRPLPPAAFKVGESSVETGAFYLADILQLRLYFDRAQLPKFGLRYFFGDTRGPVHERPELGLTAFPAFTSYQIDRGLLESDLRQMNAEAGVAFLEDHAVEDIQLSGDGPHTVLYRRNQSESGALTARWVVDATGRRRFLQKKLGLARRFGKPCSAVWWRLEGRIDVADLVPREIAWWHQLVPGDNRYYSTTHMMGDGYWFWLIPLSSGNTSVGIVALEDLHPFDTFNTYERALQWLRNHEPKVAEYIDQRTPMDFLCRRKYAYSSRRVFSADRWACVGEAGVFSDPYYSPGNDFIGFGNCIVTELVQLDRKGELTRETVDRLNLFYLSLNNFITQNIQYSYSFLGRAVPMVPKTLWDFAAAWGFVAPLMFNQIFLRPATWAKVRKATTSWFSLTLRMQGLFAEWAERSPGRLRFDYIDYLSLPFLRRLRDRNLRAGKGTEELVQDHRQNVELLEELAQVFFLLAVEDVMPERLPEVTSVRWLNAWAVSLDPAAWEEQGLFRPNTPARDLNGLQAEIRNLFRFAPRDAVQALATGTRPSMETAGVAS